MYVGDKYSLVDGVLRRKDKILVGNVANLRNNIIQHYYVDVTGGHSGTTVTVHRLKSLFYWNGMQRIVKQFIRECDTYNVFKLYGLSNSIISDMDKVFLSHFWQSLFKVLRVRLKLSTAYHPQTHGQTKVVSKCLEYLLRCMTNEKPKEWAMWLSLAEFWYNTKFHTIIQTTPFEDVYGQTPRIHAPYVAGESVVEAVDKTLQAGEQALNMLKFISKELRTG
ncbi:reverse transcriptase [Tanacetum coccineum]